MQKNYVCYHLHDDVGSVLDSCTKFNDYVDIASEYGMKAIASTNHGFNLNWCSKKLYCESKGIKYINGVECYLTSDLYHNLPDKNGEIKPTKVRDNYHTILLCKNKYGVIELNKLLEKSYNAEHKYYKPRITFNEFFNISDNIIKISACLASPLNKYNESSIDYKQDTKNKLLNTYDYLEIQPHIKSDDQKKYNQYLYSMSKQYNKPLIAATDTHSLNQYKAECRKILMVSKGIEFTGEDDFDLTFKSYNELVDMFDKQNCLPKDVYMEAIENTNVMANSVEDFTLNTKSHYPISTINAKQDATEYIEKTKKMFYDKVDKGIIPQEQVEIYKHDLKEELKTFKKTNMLGFMLSMSNIMTWSKAHGIPFGPSRGSVGGSKCAFVTDIIDSNPLQWDMIFSRFCNENRIEIGDIDVDTPKHCRPEIYKHIFDTFGKEKCAYVLALGTVSDKGTIDDIGRALSRLWIKKYPQKNESENPYSLNKISIIKKEYDENPDEVKTKYPKLFYYFNGIKDTVVSLSHHPAGVIVSPFNLWNMCGIFYDKDNLPILNLDMSASHEIGLAKYDILGLDTIDLIDKTCKYANILYPHTYEINFNDKAVWEGIKKSNIGIFQFTGDFAFDSLKKFDVQSIEDLSLVTAAIRPSGASYRESLLNHEKHKNPSKEIDKLLEKNNGFLVYQEDIIAFLQQICGLSGSDADSVRRAIGHKDEAYINKMMPMILNGYCNKSTKSREIAEQEAKEFLKVIEDASAYSFGKNHAVNYSILTYYCAYFRHYYPIEFVTALLNIADTDEKINNGVALAKLLNITIKPPKFGYSKSEYFPDKKHYAIYKGISSIKNLNKKGADELYNLSQVNHYNSFIDLLSDIKKKTSIDSRQLDILIKLDYFSDFGEINNLLEQVRIYNDFDGRSQIKKAELEKYKLTKEFMETISESVTEKLYKNFDFNKIIQYQCKNISVPKTTVIDKVKYEIDCLGYCQIIDGQIPIDYAFVISLDGKYKSKTAELYRVHDGSTEKIKIKGGTLDKYPLKVGDMIKTIEKSEEHKKYKDENGNWQDKPETEWILKKYIYVR